MKHDRAQIIDEAVRCLDPSDRPSLEKIAGMGNGLWYLNEKIIAVRDDKARRDHVRPLKYAALFHGGGAAVTFVRESTTPTPDLEVVVNGVRFFAEVRKFGMGGGRGAFDPVSKVVDAISGKRSQLPDEDIGFVIIDNFDIRMESRMAHENFEDALVEVARRAQSNANGWRKPSGVIISAASVAGPWPPPEFVWINPNASCQAPDVLVQWILAWLPGAQLVGLVAPHHEDEQLPVSRKTKEQRK